MTFVLLTLKEVYKYQMKIRENEGQSKKSDPRVLRRKRKRVRLKIREKKRVKKRE